MEQNVKQKRKRSKVAGYRLCLAALLVVILILMCWYCMTSYRQTAPSEGTLVDRVREGNAYERKA